MELAVNQFQKYLFILLLYASAVSGVVSDLAMQESKTVFYVVFDMIIIFQSLMSLTYMRSGLRYITLFLLACIAFNLSYNGASLIGSINGIREILIVICVCIYYNKIFSEGNEELAQEYVQIFKNYAIVFLILQLPVSFYQFLKYGPSDYVGGTLGNKGSGVLTLSVICLVYFLAHFTTNITQTILLYLCLLPLLLNETKISFILIPLMVLFIHFQPKLKNMLLALGAAVVFLFLFDRYYSHATLSFDDNLTGIFSSDYLSGYLLGDLSYSDDVPRLTKIVLGWHLLSEQTNTMLFGFEYGIFKGGSVVEHSNFAQTYEWLLSGTRPYLFFLMIQGGLFLVMGILWLVAYINRFFRGNNKFKIFMLIIFLMILFYSDTLRNQNFVAIYFFLVYYANSSIYKAKEIQG